MKIDNEILNVLSNAQTIGPMLKLIVKRVGSRDINSMKPRLIISLLIAIRMELRKYKAVMDIAWMEECALKRAGKKLESATAFNGHRVAMLRKSAAMISAARDELREQSHVIGGGLMSIVSAFDAATTLAQRCDILNVNLADRGALSEKDGLVNIVLLHALEDSAFYRGSEWNDGPLFNAIRWEMMRVMTETAEGRNASAQLWEIALAPGGALYGMLTYVQRSDGSMLRKAPDLTLHDQEGARIVRRKPSH